MVYKQKCYGSFHLMVDFLHKLNAITIIQLQHWTKKFITLNKSKHLKQSTFQTYNISNIGPKVVRALNN
jgi:hypothetical protein